MKEEERKALIADIKEESKYWLGFDLTDEQIQEYLDENPGVYCFDTVEREDFGSYLGKKITGMRWPMNGDDQSVKDKFWTLLNENSSKMGYKLITE